MCLNHVVNPSTYIYIVLIDLYRSQSLKLKLYYYLSAGTYGGKRGTHLSPLIAQPCINLIEQTGS